VTLAPLRDAPRPTAEAHLTGGGSVSAEPSTIFPDSGAPPGLAESIESAGTILPHAVLYRECMIGPSTLV